MSKIAHGAEWHLVGNHNALQSRDRLHQDTGLPDVLMDRVVELFNVGENAR